LADFENYKKRQAEERKDFTTFSNVNLILEILPVVDNFYASTEHIPEDQKENAWVVGIMHIRKQLEKILEDNGLREIGVKEKDEFNPTTMEAVEKEENGKESKGVVKKVIMRGYKINDRIIRAAKVSVE
jgi:molecular chaperone GrpE